jgi:hypothetical protein
MAEGERASGERSLTLLEQAAQAYQMALEIYTQADYPQEWEETQQKLKVALDELARARKN